MRTARAKVVNGKVVTQPEVELDDDDVAAIRWARASIRAGRKIPMDQLLKLLPI